MGRPFKYKPEFCELVIQLGEAGKSKAQMAAAFECDRNAIDRWCDEFEEFRNAFTRARDLSMAWWEAQAEEGIWEEQGGRKLNQALWSRSMAARFPDDYREKQGIDLTNSDGTLAPDEASRAARVAQIIASGAQRKADAEQQ